jgi:hypothetical protein
MIDKFLEFLEQKKVKEDLDTLKCPKCGCSWFTQQIFGQYSDSSTVVLTQKPSAKSSEFILFTCGRCNEKLEPRLLRQTRDSLDIEYDKFYNDMNTTVPTDKL